MNGYLLDTNVISEYSRKKKPDERLRKWVDSQNEATLYLSVLTLGEIRKGTTLLSPSKKRTELEKWLETELPASALARIDPGLLVKSDPRRFGSEPIWRAPNAFSQAVRAARMSRIKGLARIAMRYTPPAWMMPTLLSGGHFK